MKNNTITVKEFAGLYNIGLNSAYIIVRSKDFPKINIAGYHNGFFDLNNPKEILEEIKEGEDLVS